MVIEKNRVIQLVDDLVVAIFNFEKKRDKSDWPAQLAFESGLAAMGRGTKMRLAEILEDMEKMETKKSNELIDMIEKNWEKSEETKQEELIQKKLRKIAEEMNEGWKPNWHKNEKKWFLSYGFGDEDEKECQDESGNTIVFRTKKVAKQAWEKIRADIEKLYEIKHEKEKKNGN